MKTQVTTIAKQLMIELMVSAFLGVLLGILGPFGSYLMPLPLRMLQWMAFSLLGYAIYRPIGVVALWLGVHFKLPYWIAYGLGVMIASVPMTALVAWVMGARLTSLNAEQWLTVFTNTLLIGAIVSVLITFIFQHAQQEGVPDEVQAHLIPPAFMARLPIGSTLLALHAEDHYVRAYCEGREVLILIRLRDAIAELQGVDGAQVHRSWWVAREAVVARKRIGRAVQLVLCNGVFVPVSREGLAAVKDWA